MELNTIPSLFLLLTSVLLAVFLIPVNSRRCRGSYSHSCFGGNGKRSDPSFHLTDFQPPNLESRLDLPSLQESEPSLDTKLIGLLRSDLNAKLERLPVPYAPRGHRTEYQPKPRSEEGLLHRLLFTDVARLIQEDELSREKDTTSAPEGVFYKESTGDNQFPEKHTNLDALRSFIAALKLEHLLRARDDGRRSQASEALL